MDDKSETMIDEFRRQLNLVAETQFYLRPVLIKSLQKQLLTDDARVFLGKPYKDYAEYWKDSFSDRFFDMATMIRLGTAIECCLKWYYMHKKKYTNMSHLKDDPDYEQNIFQRVQSWQSNGVISLYKAQLGIDLTTLPKLSSLQEAMMHRHLYAHNSGILDQHYIDKIKKITGTDIALLPEAVSYPTSDTYWFEPLKRIGPLIEDARTFFREFP